MLRKLLVHGIILLLAAVPLAIALINYKLNFDHLVNPEELYKDPRTLVSDIASQITFLGITICILALSDYWDFRSEGSNSSRLGYSLPQLRFLQAVTVFLLSTLTLLNFLMYYGEVLSVTVLDFRVKRLAADAALLHEYHHTAAKILGYSVLMLCSSVILYLSYFCVQTEQKTLSKLFRSYVT